MLVPLLFGSAGLVFLWQLQLAPLLIGRPRRSGDADALRTHDEPSDASGPDRRGAASG
jgi:hypothetical protein